jgi:hypothetical protein
MTALSATLPTRDDLHRHRAMAAVQQDAVLTAAAPRAVVACPGAGKTRTIVNRHCATPRNQPHGRAIVSFTKVAAAQIRARAHELGRPDLLQHPHAIMTLDGFFWRFLVRPFLPTPDDANPRPFRRLESWRDAPRRLRQIDYLADSGKRHTFDLADFQFRYEGQRAAPVATLTGRPRSEGGRRHLSDAQIAAACRLAEQQRTQLANQYRLFTGEETRRAADRNLAERAHILGQTLPARFGELIVDEAQDCSDIDVNLLLAIQELGLATLVICDPDQAIYGFRNPGPPAADRLIGHTETIALTGNWRSSAAVCRLAATMRADPHRRTPDTALADHHDLDIPVHLIPLDGGKELSTFEDIAARAGIPPGERLILAHAALTLPSAGADRRRPPANPTSWHGRWRCSARLPRTNAPGPSLTRSSKPDWSATGFPTPTRPPPPITTVPTASTRTTCAASPPERSTSYPTFPSRPANGVPPPAASSTRCAPFPTARRPRARP